MDICMFIYARDFYVCTLYEYCWNFNLLLALLARSTPGYFDSANHPTHALCKYCDTPIFVLSAAANEDVVAITGATTIPAS